MLAMEKGDRGECERIARSRKTALNVAKRAQMLVLAARGLSNRQIALELGANKHAMAVSIVCHVLMIRCTSSCLLACLIF